VIARLIATDSATDAHRPEVWTIRSRALAAVWRPLATYPPGLREKPKATAGEEPGFRWKAAPELGPPAGFPDHRPASAERFESWRVPSLRSACATFPLARQLWPSRDQDPQLWAAAIRNDRRPAPDCRSHGQAPATIRRTVARARVPSERLVRHASEARRRCLGGVWLVRALTWFRHSKWRSCSWTISTTGARGLRGVTASWDMAGLHDPRLLLFDHKPPSSQIGTRPVQRGWSGNYTSSFRQAVGHLQGVGLHGQRGRLTLDAAVGDRLPTQQTRRVAWHLRPRPEPRVWTTSRSIERFGHG